MTKLKYDVSGIEESEDRGFTEYDGETPKPGVYNAHISKAEVGESSSGNQMVTWIIEIEDEPYTGAAVWLYTVLVGDDEKDWKFAETIRALGMKEGGTFDDEKVTAKKPKCRVRVTNETYEGEKRAKARKILPAEGGKKKKGSSKADDADDDTSGDEPPF